MNDMSYISCLVFAVLVFWIGFALKHCPSTLRVLRRDVLAVLLVFAVAASLVADKTNGLMRIIGQLRSLAPVAVTVTADDVARGWRVESVGTNETMSYEMPTNAAYVGNWHVHGARSSFGRNVVDFGAMRSRGTCDPTIAEWAFPLGTNFEPFTSFWYFVDGRIRPTPRDAAREIRAAGGPMFAAPGLSRLWTAEESDGGQSLTWENFFLGNDTNTPINAQIRLYENGDFTTSSNELVTVCRRVEPFDWDGDGLSNSIDPDPYTGSAECHGTSAAWYNIACSNILTAADGDCGVDLTWRDGVNQNAYYFVEVVAESGPAQIVFIASQAGNLGSPVIVAHAGETNTVPLLVGVEYAVTSTVPISVSAPSDGYAQVTFDTPRSCRIHWPISFAFAETINAPTASGPASRMYAVAVQPYDPGGVFSWAAGCQCGCMTCGSSGIAFSCTPECTCDATCVATGSFGYEGLVFPVSGGECRCGFTDTERPAMPQEEGPCVSVAFSDSAVIYEDSYQESPGVWKPKRSTRTWLTVYANGGPNGGVLSFASQNLGKMAPVACGPVVLPSSVCLASNETFSAQYLFEGGLPSTVTNDISVSGSMLPNGATGAIQSSTTLTSVKVELEAVYSAPENPCMTRHVYGIGERVLCHHSPESALVEWRLGANMSTNIIDGLFASTDQGLILHCPLTNNCAKLSVESGSVKYCSSVSYVEPSDIVAENVDYRFPRTRYPGDSGNLALKLGLVVCPKTVSFRGIALVEVPWCQGGYAMGYYAHPDRQEMRYHDENHGAGRWHTVTNGNFWGVDFAGSNTITNWSPGVLRWDIPVAWGAAGSCSLSNVVGHIGAPDRYFQCLTIETNGLFRVEKYGHWVSREASDSSSPDNGKVLLDGEERNLEEDFKRWLQELDTGDEVWIL